MPHERDSKLRLCHRLAFSLQKGLLPVTSLPLQQDRGVSKRTRRQVGCPVNASTWRVAVVVTRRETRARVVPWALSIRLPPLSLLGRKVDQPLATNHHLLPSLCHPVTPPPPKKPQSLLRLPTSARLFFSAMLEARLEHASVLKRLLEGLFALSSSLAPFFPSSPASPCLAR